MSYFEFFMLIICAINVRCQQNPNHFTEEEKSFLFPSLESVPEYEIVHVEHHVKKRSLDEDYLYVYLSAFNKSLSLYLKPKDSVLIGENTKVWSVKPRSEFSQEVDYKVITNFKNINFQTLHDVTNMAAVTMEKDDNGNIKLFGYIGDDWVIQPVPERMINHKRKKRQGYYYPYYNQPPYVNDYWRNIYNQQMYDYWRRIYNQQMYDYYLNRNRTPHVVYKLPPVKETKAKRPSNRPSQYPRNDENNFENSKLDIVYPEILLLVDNSLFKKLGGNVAVIQKYLAAYWNAVDLRYRQLTNPMVRINIAGIILSTGDEEVAFIKNSTYNKNTKIDADQVLIEIGQHLLHNKVFKFRRDYDLFITMTKYDMCNIEGEPKTESCDTLGYAYVAAACSILNDPWMVEAVGMVEDNGGFKGILPSAHELGHILGVSHDARDNDEKCKSQNGYIMEEKLAFSNHSFDWSLCSLKNFSNFLSHPNTTCLRNKPKIGSQIKTLLPGLHYSLEYQCQQYRNGSKPCYEYENVCTELYCTVPPYTYCDRIVPAAEGSHCGVNSICLDGECTYIPPRDYNHKTRNGLYSIVK